MKAGSRYQAGKWVGGLAHWVDDEGGAYVSVAFTWLLDEAYRVAERYAAMGFNVRAGGPALFRGKHHLGDVATLGGDAPDAIARHNPMATTASRGCPVGCWFCIVPAMEGREFTLLPDFPVRPVLSDNNLSALPADYQNHIVGRYVATGVPLLDANSGFEPKTFDDEVFARWRPINRGVWRFAYDEMKEGDDVRRSIEMLKRHGVRSRKIQVYVLIGNEPIAECMGRIRQVIEWGGEPYVQPVLKLNATSKAPWVRYDWNSKLLRRVQRWANAPPQIWRRVPFAEYDSSLKGHALP